MRSWKALLVMLVIAVTPLEARQEPASEDTTEVIPVAPLSVNILRTPISMESSPFAVGVLGEPELRRGRSGVFVEEALQGLPGVQVQNRFNPAVGERIAIRGFGARAQFGLRGIRVLVDGIPATLPDGQSSLDHLDIGTLGRVEVIRGPASALFGNASGGVLSFATRAAAPEPVRLEAEAVGGSHGLLRTQTTASGTVNGTEYLVSVSKQQWDGFRRIAEGSPRADTLGSYGGSDRLGLNARLSRPLAGGQLFLTVNALDLSAENAGSTDNDFRDDPSFDINDLYLRFRTRKDLSQQQAGARWAGPLSGAWNGDFSAYVVRRNVYNPIPFNVVDLKRNGGGLRAQIGRATSLGFGALDIQGGVELDIQSDDRRETAAPFGTGKPASDAEPDVDQQETVRGAGAFLQGVLTLPNGVMAMAGIRYDNQHFEAEDRRPVTEDDPDDSGSRTLDAFSPSLGVSVPVAPGINLFGSISTVFETPVTTELTNQPTAAGGFNQSLEPVRGRSIEVGLRGRLGARAAFEVTTYQTNLNNELVPFEVPGTDGVTFFRNAGSSRHRGVEATLSATSTSGLLRADVTYTYTDARFEEYLLNDEDLGGNRVPGLAPQRVQGVLRFNPNLGFGEIVGTYVDVVPVNDTNTASAPSYFLVDVRAGLNPINAGGISVAPWVAVANVTDERYIASAAVNATGNRYYEPGPSRSLQFGLRAVWAHGN